MVEPQSTDSKKPDPTGQAARVRRSPEGEWIPTHPQTCLDLGHLWMFSLYVCAMVISGSPRLSISSGPSLFKKQNAAEKSINWTGKTNGPHNQSWDVLRFMFLTATQTSIRPSNSSVSPRGERPDPSAAPRSPAGRWPDPVPTLWRTQCLESWEWELGVKMDLFPFQFWSFLHSE